MLFLIKKIFNCALEFSTIKIQLFSTRKMTSITESLLPCLGNVRLCKTKFKRFEISNKSWSLWEHHEEHQQINQKSVRISQWYRYVCLSANLSNTIQEKFTVWLGNWICYLERRLYTRQANNSLYNKIQYRQRNQLGPHLWHEEDKYNGQEQIRISLLQPPPNRRANSNKNLRTHSSCQVRLRLRSDIKF